MALTLALLVTVKDEKEKKSWGFYPASLPVACDKSDKRKQQSEESKKTLTVSQTN